MSQPLPFQPEPLERLQARFSAAIATEWDADDLTRKRLANPDHPDRPGQCRTHVFDTEDGYRLIISRERSQSEGLYLHVSASCENLMPRTHLFTGAAFRLGAIALKTFHIIRTAISTGGTVHFVLKLEEQPANVKAFSA